MLVYRLVHDASTGMPDDGFTNLVNFSATFLSRILTADSSSISQSLFRPVVSMSNTGESLDYLSENIILLWLQAFSWRCYSLQLADR